MSHYVELYQLTKSYPGPNGVVTVVKQFNLTIEKGEFVCLIGHSGCGKSTVLSMLAGLNEATSGSIILAGKELAGPGPDRGIVFQSPCLLPWLTAFENVRLGVDQVFYTASKEERAQIAEYFLSIVGLGEAMHKKPAELSQGMRQRVGIARAFALAPKMLLLDEPFGMLDSLTRVELQQVLLDLWRRDRKTALMVTHDVDEALFLADRIVMMTNGPEAEVGDILRVPFARPRVRQEVLEHPEYYRLRERLIDFLERCAHRRNAPPIPRPSDPETTPKPLSRLKATDAPERRLEPRHAFSLSRVRSEGNSFLSKLVSVCLATAALLTSAVSLRAQYAPPPPPAPFVGFINEALRQRDPYMNQWDIGGSARVRYEVKDGFAIPGVAGSLDFRDHGADVDNDYFLERIRYRIGYTEKWWGALVEGRSSFAQSDERFAYPNNPPVSGTRAYEGRGPESDTLDLHQAYVTLGNHKEFPLSLKIGRQELSYGEERLIGAFGWNNIGRVFDAAKLRWQTPWFGADFFASRVVIPEDTRFNVNNDYEWFSGMYATSTIVPKNLLDVYVLSRNASSEAIVAEPRPQTPQPSARDIYTVGFRLKSKPDEFGHWDYLLDAAFQFGNFQDLRLGANPGRLDHEAYMVVAQAGYTFADAWATPRLGLEYAHGSGDSDPTDKKHETFDNLYPTNHRFYGYMDLLSIQNLHDLRGILQLKPHPRVSMGLEGHGFWLADTHDNLYNVAGAPRGGIAATPAGNGYGINPGYSNFVGTELDVIVGYALTRFAQLEAGYGHFFVGDYIQSSLSAPTHGSTDADWVYIQANIAF